MTPLNLKTQISNITYRLLGLLLVATALGLVLVPWDANVPIHWNLQGAADSFATGWFAVLIPFFLGLVLLLFFLVIRRLDSEKEFDAARHPYEVTVNAVLAFVLVLEGATIYIGRGGDLNMQSLLVACAGVLLIVVGNALPKTRPSWQAGLPLRWTKNDPNLWRVAQRWFARAHVVSGMVLVVLALAGLTGPLLIASLVVLALLPTLIALFVANRLGRNPRQKGPPSGAV